MEITQNRDSFLKSIILIFLLVFTTTIWAGPAPTTVSCAGGCTIQTASNLKGPWTTLKIPDGSSVPVSGNGTYFRNTSGVAVKLILNSNGKSYALPLNPNPNPNSNSNPNPNSNPTPSPTLAATPTVTSAAQSAGPNGEAGSATQANSPAKTNFFVNLYGSLNTILASSSTVTTRTSNARSMFSGKRNARTFIQFGGEKNTKLKYSLRISKVHGKTVVNFESNIKGAPPLNEVSDADYADILKDTVQTLQKINPKPHLSRQKEAELKKLVSYASTVQQAITIASASSPDGLNASVLSSLSSLSIMNAVLSGSLSLVTPTVQNTQPCV